MPGALTRSAGHSSVWLRLAWCSAGMCSANALPGLDRQPGSGKFAGLVI
jgi:hypothetical protein